MSPIHSGGVARFTALPKYYLLSYIYRIRCINYWLKLIIFFSFYETYLKLISVCHHTIEFVRIQIMFQYTTASSIHFSLITKAENEVTSTMEVTTRTDMSSTTADIFAAVSFSFSVIAIAISVAVAAILVSSCKCASVCVTNHVSYFETVYFFHRCQKKKEKVWKSKL